MQFFRCLPTEQLAKVSALMQLRVCARGDRATPPDDPSALVLVSRGSVETIPTEAAAPAPSAPAIPTTATAPPTAPAAPAPAHAHAPAPAPAGVQPPPPQPTITHHSSARCWCNEAALVGRRATAR